MDTFGVKKIEMRISTNIKWGTLMTKMPDTNLFVGNIDDYSITTNDEWAVVHATQTIHYQIFGWNRTTNKPNKDHPNYIFYEKDNRLSLNWVDGASYLYKLSGNETFIKTLDFIEKWLPKRKVLVHCDQGFSRSPSLCLLFLSKRKNSISNISYQAAKNDFMQILPQYSPGGIGDYINDNWNEIA